jgi:hypothetical protein
MAGVAVRQRLLLVDPLSREAAARFAIFERAAGPFAASFEMAAALDFDIPSSLSASYCAGRLIEGPGLSLPGI